MIFGWNFIAYSVRLRLRIPRNYDLLCPADGYAVRNIVALLPAGRIALYFFQLRALLSLPQAAQGLQPFSCLHKKTKQKNAFKGILPLKIPVETASVLQVTLHFVYSHTQAPTEIAGCPPPRRTIPRAAAVVLHLGESLLEKGTAPISQKQCAFLHKSTAPSGPAEVNETCAIAWRGKQTTKAAGGQRIARRGVPTCAENNV